MKFRWSLSFETYDLRLFNKYAHFYNHFISCFLLFHSLLCKHLRLTQDFYFWISDKTLLTVFDSTQNECLLMGSGKRLDPVFLVGRFNVTFLHSTISARSNTLDTLCVHLVKSGPDEWSKGSFWSHWKQNIPERAFLFNTILSTKQKNMICELFKSNQCECIRVFNCTITLMAVNLFSDCDDSSCYWDEFILETWSDSNDLDNGEVFVCREVKFRKGLQRKKARIQWISQYHIASICKMFFFFSCN